MFSLSLIGFHGPENAWAEPLKVESLDWGNCWVTETEGEIQLASFADKKTFSLRKSHLAGLKSEITQILQRHHLEESFLGAYEVYLHCQSHGAFLHVNFYEGDLQLCVQIKPQHSFDKPLAIIEVYPNHEEGRGFCEGQSKGSLLIKFNKDGNGEDVKSCEKKLREGYSHVFSQLTSSKGAIFAKLKANYFYKENQVKELLLQDEDCQKVLNSENIEFDSLRSPGGEFFKLMEVSEEF